MKAEYVNPFINATRSLMEMMVGIKRFEKKELSLEQHLKSAFDVSAVIGIAGDCKGSVVLSFSRKIATAMLTRLIKAPVGQFDDEVCDAAGEMLNIIAGNTCAELAEKGVGNLRRSIPTVIVGHGHTIASPSNTPCVRILFMTELGDFSMQVSLKCNLNRA